MKIQESAENYLEAILMLQERNGQVRSIDIVNELNFSKPSISVAMKRLRENGYITMDKDGLITLTETGMAIAQRMYERHKTLTDFLIMLGVRDEVEGKNAVKVTDESQLCLIVRFCL